ncbi:hypothetical protein AMJ80_02425 [bacterium SM23_31]|nr:MAG: hypothetical protein AMJ80_02425 [bacterium SM23_31]
MEIIQRRKLPPSAYTKEETEKKLIVVHWIAGNHICGFGTFEHENAIKSAHYIISHTGKVYQLLDEKYIAHHAGYSILRGYSTYGPYRGKNVDWHSLNPCAIGIEISGPPTDVNKAYKRIGEEPTMSHGWPEAEIVALIDLCIDIAGRWPGIKLTDHSSIVARYDKVRRIFLKDENGNYIRSGKVDVKKGKGIDVFPWVRLLKETGIEEA